MEIFRRSEITQLAAMLETFEGKTQVLQSKSVVYFVGITGSGKSLIINHMLGHALELKKLHGTKQIVLKDPSGQNKAEIGTKLATSCTQAPQLFQINQYNDIILCDTAGYNDQGPITQSCQMLNELYLTKAQEVTAIIFVININDLRSQRGAGFNSVFQQLDRISNFSEIKKKIQFIINYKNVYEEELEDLFQQLKGHQKEICGNNNHKTQTIQNKYNQFKVQSKSKFFQAIFDKESSKQEPVFQKFINKVIIATKSQLLNQKSNLRKVFFNRVLAMKGKQKLHLNPSKSRILLTKHLVRAILSKQIAFQKCLAKYQIYFKSQLIQVNFWNHLELESENFTMKANRLSDVLLSTDIDDQSIKNLILQLHEQIEQFEHLSKKLFKAYTFKEDQSILQNIQQLPITFHLHFQIKILTKQIEGFTIVKESIDYKKGKYEARLKSIAQQKHKRVNICAISSYEERDKEMVEHLYKQKQKFENKLQSKSMLEILPLKQELDIMVEIVNKTKDQKYFIEFVHKYSINNEDMFRHLPTRDQIELYYAQLLIYKAIVSNVKVNKQCINLGFLDRLKLAPLLKFDQQCSGYCAINYHKINHLVRLQCGHDYQQFCFIKKYKKPTLSSTLTKSNDKKQLQLSQKLQKQAFQREKFQCIICKKIGKMVEIDKETKELYKSNFQDFFKIKINKSEQDKK